MAYSSQEKASQEKIIGVIGGLGPIATADFFNRIIKNTPAKEEQDHLHIIIDNNPKAPNRNRALNGTGSSPTTSLRKSALRLKQAGAQLLVMPCNTAHAFKEAITHTVDTPFLDIIDETVAYIIREFKGLKKVGLLAADGCLKAGLYQDGFKDKGIDLTKLNTPHQKEFMTLVYRIKASGVNAPIQKAMQHLAKVLIGNGAEAVIAGCTEVPLALEAGDLPVPLIDSTEILARQCVRYARNEI